MASLEQKLARAIAALEAAADYTSYSGEDDEVGYRPCCQVVSYEPHSKDCNLKRALDYAKS